MYSTLVELRAARNAKLAATDYLFVSDYPSENLVGFIEPIRLWRQQLRDITKGVTEETVGSVTLPTIPQVRNLGI